MRTAIAPAHPPTRDVHTGPSAPAPASRAPISAAQLQRLRSELRSLMRRSRDLLGGAEQSVDLDLSPVALDVLAHVVGRRRVSPRTIAQHLRLDGAPVSRAVSELRQLGLVVSVTDSRKPTSVVLAPTSMGRRVHGDDGAATEVLHAVLEGWRAEEAEELTRLLGRLNRRLRDESGQSPMGRRRPTGQSGGIRE